MKVTENATRPMVDAFADEMEAKLAANRHKGDRAGWMRVGAEELLDMLMQEVIELRVAVREAGGVTEEAADVANFAMMIADVCGGLEPKPAAAYRRGLEDAAKVCDDMGGWRDWAELKHPNFPGAPCEAAAAADWLAAAIRKLGEDA